jgi:hypothetical protein
MDRTRIHKSVDRLLSGVETAEVGSAKVLDEISRMTPNQFGAAFIYFNNLTDKDRCNMISLLIDNQ